MVEQSIYRRLFWPVYAPSILFGVAGGATVPVFVVAAMNLGASAALAALVVALLGAVGLATTVQAGRLIDRVGDRRAMLAATAVAAVCDLGSIAALLWRGQGAGRAALALFIVANLVQAPASMVWGLARQAFTAEHAHPHERGRAMTGLGGTMRIGALVGPLLGGLLLLRLPLWTVYLLSVGCATLAVVILYVPSLGGRIEAGAVPVSPSRGAGRDATGGRLDVDWTRVALAGVAICTLAVARVAQAVLLQLWGVHQGLDGSRISLVIAVGAAVEIVLMFPGGALKDRVGRAAILVACLAIYGLGYLLLVPLSQLWGIAGMVAAVVVMAVGNGLGAGVNMTIGADLSPSVGRARFLGYWALFTGSGALGGPLVISALVKLASIPAAVAAVGAVTLAGAAWTILLAPRMALPRHLGRQPSSH